MEMISKFEPVLAQHAAVVWRLYQDAMFSGNRQRPEDMAEWRGDVRECKRLFSQFSVANGGGRTPYIYTTQDASAKLIHNEDFTDLYEQIVHYGAPARTSGVLNMCPSSTPGCRASCLHTSGQLGMDNQQRATIIRTRFMYFHPRAFLTVQLDELDKHKRRIARKGRRMVQRTNGTTDVAWERVWPQAFFAVFGSQDYTKRIERMTDDRVPLWYYLVVSATERTNIRAIDGNVVVPVHVRRGEPLPETFEGRPVVDGDKHDLRLLDPQGGFAVLVRAKGKGIHDRTGFVREVEPALV